MSAAVEGQAAATDKQNSESPTGNETTTLLSSSSSTNNTTVDIQTGSGTNESIDKSEQNSPTAQIVDTNGRGQETGEAAAVKEEGKEGPAQKEEKEEEGKGGTSEEEKAATDGAEEGEIGPQPLTASPADTAGSDADMMLLDDSSGDAAAMGDDMLDWFSDSDRESKRVKVYELVGSAWEDQGTAFCTGVVQDDSGEAYLVARAEKDATQVVLSTAIKANDVYQRQQETLIVWTEPDGVDYALSFQDPDGCTEVWNFINEVQKHMNATDPSLMSSSPVMDATDALQTGKAVIASFLRTGQLPPPAVGTIDQIELALRQLGRTPALKERICEYILTEDYLSQLMSVFSIAEDLEDIENLHAICGLMQTILMLNDHNLYDHILEDELFFGVLGMLEYDPEFPTHKGNFRDFIHQVVHFHQPIDIKDKVIQRKIHQTYRLQFLKDVVLARTLDDSTFNVLNSGIIFNQIDIIAHVQGEPAIVREIVLLFVEERLLAAIGEVQLPGGKQLNGHSEPNHNKMDVDHPPEMSSPTSANGTSTSPENQQTSEQSPELVSRRKEVVLLVQQLCIMGKNIQLPARLQLFRSLVERGILFVVQWAMGLPEQDEQEPMPSPPPPTSTSEESASSESNPLFTSQPALHNNINIISAGGEILASLLDHDLLGVRQFLLRQITVADKGVVKSPFGNESLLSMLCRVLCHSRDLGLQSLIGDCVRTWLEMSQDGGMGGGGEAGGRLQTGGKKDEPSNERFLDYFYKGCVGVLMKPLSSLPEWKSATDKALVMSREATNRSLILCDILYGIVAQHQFRSYLYVMSSNIMSRIATLLRAKDKHLRHAAFRFFRLLLKMNNVTLRNQMMKNDVLKPILDLTIRESRRDNLVSCSCQEFFETIRRENIRDLVAFCVNNHREEIDKLAESPLGAERFKLFIRRHEINIEPPPVEAPTVEKQSNTRWSGQRAMEKAEEDYFLGDDNEEDDFVVSISQQHNRSSGPSSNNLKRKRRMPSITSSPSLRGSGFQPKPIKPARNPLESLSDYSDDDDDEVQAKLDMVFPDSHKAPESVVREMKEHLRGAGGFGSELFDKTVPSSSSAVTASSAPVASSSTTPTLQPPPRRAQPDEDDEDNLLESLVKPKSKTASPTLTRVNVASTSTAAASSFDHLPKPGEKRRREADEEEDESLERLAKKPDLGTGKSGSSTTTTGSSSTAKQGDDPPPASNPSTASSSPSLPTSSKKIQVKLGAIGKAVASSSPSPSPSPSAPTASVPDTPAASSSSSSSPGSSTSTEHNAKDGDTG